MQQPFILFAQKWKVLYNTYMSSKLVSSTKGVSMRFNSAPVGVLFFKLVAQKRNGEVLAYTLLASDQSKVTQKTAIFTKSFTADLETSNVPTFAEEIRAKLNYESVTFA
jgi:hypothetical protein